MSASLVPLPSVAVLDPRMTVNHQEYSAVLKSASQIMEQQFPSNNYSTSSVSFTANPPSPKVIVDRYALMTFYLDFEFTGTTTGTQLLNIGSTDALQAFPVQTNVTNIDARFNNAKISMATSEILPALLRIGMMQREKGLDFMCPTQQDASPEFSDLFGFARNPLGSYGDSTGELLPRGCDVYYNVISNTVESAHVQCVVTEPVILPPFSFGKQSDYAKGFMHLNNFDMTLTLSSNLATMWAHDQVSSGTTLSSVAVTLYNNPVLSFRYLTPDALFYSSIPKAISYNYFNVDRYVTQGPTLAPGASMTLPTTNINLKSLPTKLILFAQEQYSDRSVNKTIGTFAYIPQINVTFNGSTGLLAGASAQQLFQMSKSNGLSYSWEEHSTQIGSVIIISFGKDLQIGSGASEITAPGLAGNYNIQANVTIQNINTHRSITFQLYMVTIENGSLVLAGNKTFLNLGIITPEDVLNSHEMPMVDYHAVQNLEGGGPFDFFKDIARKIVSGAEKILPHVIEHGPKALSIARSLTGMGGRKHRRKRRGGAFVGGDLLSMYTGGKMMTRKMLKERASRGASLQELEEEDTASDDDT